MKGSACFGSEIPRFSVSGTSCDVPGKELLSRANWTRPLYARGNKNATSCPVNMADITTAEECRAAADLLGVTFMEDEVDDDWPTGCYEIVAGPFEGAYFNSAKPGMPVEGVPSLCRTLPAAAPATDGRCSEHYNLRNGGCELKLPFQILASGSQCPQEEKVRFPHACMQAADILGVMYGGHSNSMHHPYGCYQDFETKELHFNSENGAVNKDAGVVCQQRFSFSVVDPRLTYTLSTLRFSQDGNAVLFSIMDSEALGQECDMAYGRQWCKLLAKHEPDKALLNADSFGYYVLALVGYADKKSGRMALHWAARQGKLEVVQWLVLEHGLPVDAQTKDCTTPFQLGAWGGHVEVCQWLLLKKADLWHQNSWSCLAHHFAALAGMEACCRWLRQQGLDLGTPNNQGHNALHKAAYGGHAALCQWLQDEVDLDPAECDVRGQNAAALARKAGFEDLAQRLEQNA
ncbi:unnamed protein product [Effrenium voratum]|nr:unnamed protein product [Effrenium voratum]